MQHNNKIFLNWKLNFPENWQDFSNLKQTVIFPPSIFLEKLISHGILCGIQNVSQQNSGSFTGETSALMAKNVGVKYSLVGHSERRNIFGETIQIATQKVQNCIENEIIPILCIGEKFEEKLYACEVLENQLKSFSNSSIIAYEPVWSIGTGVVPSTQEIEQMISFIKQKTNNATVLYGGSVTSQNILTIMQSGCDGILVGSAGLKISEAKIMSESI